MSQLEESQTPAPDPSGALVPPGNRPPTLTATALLPNPESPRRLPRGERSPWQRLMASTKALVNAVLDVTDDAVDRVAAAVGLRRESSP